MTDMLLLTPEMPFPDPFPKGALMLVDKPMAWTSFDVVNKIRFHLCRRLGVKKLKVGHAGTLDPLATGLLAICVGEYTKRIDSLQGQDKEYTGTFTLGATTPSYDLEKEPDQFFPTAHLTDALLNAVKTQFVGEIKQFPPIFSAVKLDGKKLYDSARQGVDVMPEARTVTISEFELGPLRPVEQGSAVSEILNSRGAPIYLHPEFDGGLKVDFRLVVSKGTYIRSIAYDFGKALDSGGYLSQLRRTRSGALSVENAGSIAQWQAFLTSNR